MKRAELFLKKLYGKDDVVVREDTSKAFLWVLDNIPKRFSMYHDNPSYKEYTKMYFFGGYTMRDIAKTFEVSPENVRQKIEKVLVFIRRSHSEVFKIGLNEYLAKIKEEQERINKLKADSSYIPLVEIADTIPARIFVSLRRAGLEDLSSVYRAYADGSLKNVRNLGTRSYRQVLNILRENGYEIKEEV